MGIVRQLLLPVLAAPGLTSCTPADRNMDELIQRAHADRQHLPELAKRLTSQHVFIVAGWESLEATTITIQDFVRNGRSFIPVFSDRAHFERETRGSGFESRGVSIDGNLLASMLSGDELLVLNPGSPTPVEISAGDLKACIDPARLPKPER